MSRNVDANLPAFMTRRELAEHIGRTRFRISRRTIERWPIPFRIIAGRTRLDTQKALAHADMLIKNAPTVAGGKVPRRELRVPSETAEGGPAKRHPQFRPA
jgi:hypothetical protein